MTHTLIQQFEKPLLKDKFQGVSVGQTIQFTYKFTDGDKERSQRVEGLVIAKKHGRGLNGTITIRTSLDGFGVDRIFPIHSPFVESVKVKGTYKVRRSKLYYLRGRTGKAARLKRVG